MVPTESRKRLLNFDLLELPKDVFNMVDGPNYAPFLDVTEMRPTRSVSSELPGIWSGRSHITTSLDELNTFMDLEANPNVINIREGYPYFTQEVLQSLLDGEEAARNRVMTIDFVLTLPPINFWGPLRYLGLNSKPDLVAAKPAARRRFDREEKALAQVGWTWARVRPPSMERVVALRTLRAWALPAPIDDAAKDASHLAAALYRTTSTKELGALLRMLGRRLGISESDQYFVFSAAFYLGYLAVEKDSSVDKHLPLRLAPTARSLSRVLPHV